MELCTALTVFYAQHAVGNSVWLFLATFCNYLVSLLNAIFYDTFLASYDFVHILLRIILRLSAGQNWKRWSLEQYYLVLSYQLSLSPLQWKIVLLEILHKAKRKTSLKNQQWPAVPTLFLQYDCYKHETSYPYSISNLIWPLILFTTLITITLIVSADFHFQCENSLAFFSISIFL